MYIYVYIYIYIASVAWRELTSIHPVRAKALLLIKEQYL